MGRSKLQKVWNEVEADYRMGIVNSERCLQACLYRAARDQLCGVKTFVEPGLLYQQQQGQGSYELVPDLVLCKDDAVLSVIEIKFTPHWPRPDYTRDASKFNRLWERRETGHQIPIDPRTGHWTNQKLRINGDTCFVFAVIAKHDAPALNFDTVAKELSAAVRERFVLLSGRIRGEEDEPEFHIYGLEE